MESFRRDEEIHAEQSSITKSKLMDLSNDELMQLISHLEREIHNRDAVINEMMNQQTKQALYQAKYSRFGAGDPFTALQRDSDKVSNDSFDHNQVKSVFDNQLQQLENLIETQKRAQAKMREQKLAADERYKKVCQELEEAKRQHAQDTAQGDDVTVALEKEREKLQHDLAYARSQSKKMEKELKKVKAELEQQLMLASKHKQVALDLIKERRKMVSKIVESEKRNQAIAQLLQKEKEDNQKSENSKLLQLEARMEKQLMEFDIEREQYKARIRKEESKVKELVQQLNDIKDTVLSLQRESVQSPIQSPTLNTNSNEPQSDIVRSQTSSQLVTTKQLNQSNVVLLHSASDTIDTNMMPQTAKLTQGPSLSPPPSTQLSPGRTSAYQKSALVQDNNDRSNSAPAVTSTVRQVPLISQKPTVSTSNISNRNVTISGIKSPNTLKQVTVGMGDSVARLSSQSTTGNVQTKQTDRPSSTSLAQVIPTVTTKTILPSSNGTKYIPRSSPVINTSSLITKTTTSSNISSSGDHSKLSNKHIPTHTLPKPSVPPHLGSPSLIENKASLSKKVSPVTTPTTTASEEPANTKAKAISSTSNPTKNLSLPKPKPPPPIRNVSLPNAKKYQPLETSGKLISGSTSSTH